jgi:hypothetical protein
MIIPHAIQCPLFSQFQIPKLKKQVFFQQLFIKNGNFFTDKVGRIYPTMSALTNIFY